MTCSKAGFSIWRPSTANLSFPKTTDVFYISWPVMPKFSVTFDSIILSLLSLVSKRQSHIINSTISLSFFFFFFFFCFLGPYPWHIEVPRLGVKSELQLPPHTTVYATSSTHWAGPGIELESWWMGLLPMNHSGNSRSLFHTHYVSWWSL